MGTTTIGFGRSLVKPAALMVRHWSLGWAADLPLTVVLNLARLGFSRSSCASQPGAVMPTMNLLVATTVSR